MCALRIDSSIKLMITDGRHVSQELSYLAHLIGYETILAGHHPESNIHDCDSGSDLEMESDQQLNTVTLRHQAFADLWKFIATRGKNMAKIVTKCSIMFHVVASPKSA